MFRVTEEGYGFSVGEIISLRKDDGSNCPFFWKEDGSNYWSISFSELEPYVKTVRDAQVGDVVVGKMTKNQHMVLERLQNIVILSYVDNFKRAAGNYTFDELEEYYTLKDAPVVDDKTAEAIELLKKAGYKIAKE